MVRATHPPFFFLGMPGETGSMIAAGASVAGSLVFGSSPIAESLIVRLSFTFPPNPAPYCAKAKREDGVRFCPTASEVGRLRKLTDLKRSKYLTIGAALRMSFT